MVSWAVDHRDPHAMTDTIVIEKNQLPNTITWSSPTAFFIEESAAAHLRLIILFNVPT